MSNHRVRTVAASELHLGDVVVPDSGPRRRVTLHRIQGAHPMVAVQYAEIPGATTYYPAMMPLLIEDTTPPPRAGRVPVTAGPTTAAGQVELHERLRAWARGMYTSEAATELMIRSFHGRFVYPRWPWMHRTDRGAWIDFAAIPTQIDLVAGTEQRLLRIAASIGDPDTDVNLSDTLPGLDRTHLRLVLAAVAHAAGSHEQWSRIVHPDGTLMHAPHPSLYPWEPTPTALGDAAMVGRGRHL